MHQLRRTATVIASLAVSVLGLVAAAPAAFAMRVVPPEGATDHSAPIYTVSHGGMAGWEITLIALAAAVVAAAATAVVQRVRLHPTMGTTAR